MYSEEILTTLTHCVFSPSTKIKFNRIFRLLVSRTCNNAPSDRAGFNMNIYLNDWGTRWDTNTFASLFEQLMALCTKKAAKCLQLWIKLETSYVCVAPPNMTLTIWQLTENQWMMQILQILHAVHFISSRLPSNVKLQIKHRDIITFVD